MLGRFVYVTFTHVIYSHTYVLSDSISPAEFRKRNFRKINIEFGETGALGALQFMARIGSLSFDNSGVVKQARMTNEQV